MRALIAVGLLFLCCSAWSQSPAPQPPLLSGYITREASGSDFDVNSVRILCGNSTQIKLPASGDTSLVYFGCFRTPPVLGQAMDVYGHKDKKLHGIAADRIDVKRIDRDDVSGAHRVSVSGTVRELGRAVVRDPRAQSRKLTREAPAT
jgi:hypothetical protein